IKADAITEQAFENTNNDVYGILYEIRGNTASSVQFVLTDSTKNFLRGALYFNNRPNKDSLAPVINYIKDDVIRIMETTKWQ
ncbi:MAG: gliding motility lipoprotein GldD, partial [Paludibacteraceae bacterium]|nr:gliding motility lipoprotein GldD [Paludibacteraceae bacterium]